MKRSFLTLLSIMAVLVMIPAVSIANSILIGDASGNIGTVDTDTGAVSEVGHEIYQKKITDKILILHSHKGSASGMWAMYRLKDKGLAPKAIIMPKADAIVIAAAIMGKIPTIDSLDFNPMEKFKTGDKLRVNGDKGTVELLD